MNYIPVIYKPDNNNPHVIYLSDLYVNYYYKQIPNSLLKIGDCFESILQNISKPNEFMLYSVEPENIMNEIKKYNLPSDSQDDLLNLIKLYVLCIPLNNVLISSLMYKNSLLQFLIIKDPYFTSQLLDYNIYNAFTEKLNLDIRYNYYSKVAFNELTEIFFRDYLELNNYNELYISPIHKYHLYRFNDYLNEIIQKQSKTHAKAYKFMQIIDNLFLTDLYERNVSSGSLLSPEDYDTYLSIINNTSTNSIGLNYNINEFFYILTNNYTSRDSYEILKIIRSRIKEELFINYIDAPVEYPTEFKILSISDFYHKVYHAIYIDIMSYLFHAEITQMGILEYISKEIIVNYLCNLILSEFLSFTHWIISNSIGYIQKDNFIHRLATYMQHCLINKEVLLNASYS